MPRRISSNYSFVVDITDHLEEDARRRGGGFIGPLVYAGMPEFLSTLQNPHEHLTPLEAAEMILESASSGLA